MLVPALVPLIAQAPASACRSADEPEFATTKDHPAQIGGGAMSVAARARRYLDALRGPMGETLQYRRTASIPVDPERRATQITFQVKFGPR